MENGLINGLVNQCISQCPVLSDHAKTFIDILYVVSADWLGGGGIAED